MVSNQLGAFEIVLTIYKFLFHLFACVTVFLFSTTLICQDKKLNNAKTRTVLGLSFSGKSSTILTPWLKKGSYTWNGPTGFLVNREIEILDAGSKSLKTFDVSGKIQKEISFANLVQDFISGASLIAVGTDRYIFEANGNRIIKFDNSNAAIFVRLAGINISYMEYSPDSGFLILNVKKKKLFFLNLSGAITGEIKFLVRSFSPLEKDLFYPVPHPTSGYFLGSDKSGILFPLGKKELLEPEVIGISKDFLLGVKFADKRGDFYHIFCYDYLGKQVYFKKFPIGSNEFHFKLTKDGELFFSIFKFNDMIGKGKYVIYRYMPPAIKIPEKQMESLKR
ncbi:hypothetical protein ACFL35_09650 [Candidatus Riflebacteria bacterium]